VKVELLSIRECPHVPPTRRLVRDVLDRLATETRIDEILVGSVEEAERLGFAGSPTIHVDGLDIEIPLTSPRPGLGCRLYGRTGTPPRWLVEAAVLRALAPRGLLFLCVANSARSQLAEGIARQLAPPHVRVWAAGSPPTAVRPEAIRVLEEIGIDASVQHAKGLDSVPPGSADAIVTLCAEEDACPLFPGKVHRLHWSLPDPAAAPGDLQERLVAFRAVRDELVRRLRVVLAGHTCDRGVSTRDGRTGWKSS